MSTNDTARIEALTPTVVQVAHRLWARTKEHGGQTRGDFNDQTRPTAAIVAEFIQSSVTDVLGYCPLLPEPRWPLGREAVVIRTCMKIEESFRPEQANEAESAWSLFRSQWLDLMGGGQSGQRGSLCGSGGGGGDDGVEGWRVDTVTCRGIAAAADVETAALIEAAPCASTASRASTARVCGG
jgi:hypothetical protein